MNETKSACVKAAEMLSAIRAKRVQPIPKGWFTIDDLSAQLGISKESTRIGIIEMKNSNLLEEKNWPCLDAKGRVFHKRIYRNI
jgi:hypothetical protein